LSATAVTELYDSRNGSQELDHGRRVYVRTFRVYTNALTDGPEVAIGATGLGIPTLTTAYPTDAGCLLKKVEANPDQNFPLTWIVKCNYDSVLPDPTTQNQNPLSRPAKYVFGLQKYQEAQEEDQDGVPYQNSACQPFDPPYMVEKSRPTIEITKNFATFSFPSVVSLYDSVNDDTWNGFDPEIVKCDTVSVTQNWENGATYWECKYNLTINFDGWNSLNILDSGMYVRNCGESSSLTDCSCPLTILRDTFGSPVNNAQLLDGFGNLSTDGPHYLEFAPYRRVAFTGLIPT
jgi:hypothetical protein